MKINRLFIIILLTIFLSLDVSSVWSDAQSDISPEEAVSIIKNYEKAYMNKDLDKMIEHIDENSPWFKKGFLEEFKAIFKTFTNIRLYHFKDKRSKDTFVYYLADGVDIGQYTLYVAYSSSITDINEFTELYHLKKVDGKYKIADCVHMSGEDVELVDKGTGAMLKNDAERAISYFKEALKFNPENSAAHFRLGMIYSKTGKLEEAIQSVKKAVELRPKAGFYRFYLSQIYIQLGNKERAAEELQNALLLDPGLEIFFSEKQDKKDEKTIILKSGKVYKGKIIEETDKYIKIDYFGVDMIFFLDDIERIE